MPQPNHNTYQQWNTENQQYSAPPQPRMMGPQTYSFNRPFEIVPRMRAPQAMRSPPNQMNGSRMGNLRF